MATQTCRSRAWCSLCVLQGSFLVICLLPYPGNAWGEYLIMRQPGWGWGQSWAPLNPAAMEGQSWTSTSLTLVLPEECSAIWALPTEYSHRSLSLEVVSSGIANFMFSLVVLSCCFLTAHRCVWMPGSAAVILVLLGWGSCVTPRFCRHKPRSPGGALCCQTQERVHSVVSLLLSWGLGRSSAALKSSNRPQKYQPKVYFSLWLGAIPCESAAVKPCFHLFFSLCEMKDQGPTLE